MSSRRLAWSVFALICVFYVAGLIATVPTGDDSADTDWGISGTVSGVAFVLSTFLFALVGVLVAARKPGNAVGWILLAIGATWGLDLVCSSYATYGLDLHRGSHDLAVVAAVDRQHAVGAGDRADRCLSAAAVPRRTSADASAGGGSPGQAPSA